MPAASGYPDPTIGIESAGQKLYEQPDGVARSMLTCGNTEMLVGLPDEGRYIVDAQRSVEALQRSGRGIYFSL
jgi:hypothetical protein